MNKNIITLALVGLYFYLKKKPLIAKTIDTTITPSKTTIIPTPTPTPIPAPTPSPTPPYLPDPAPPISIPFPIPSPIPVPQPVIPLIPKPAVSTNLKGVVQFYPWTDHAAAKIIGAKYGFHVARAANKVDLLNYELWILVGGQHRNPIYAEMAKAGVIPPITQPTVDGKGRISTGTYGKYQVIGVAGWTTEETSAAAKRA